MSNQADIAVSAPDERVQLVVEVKNVRGASPEWAAQLRRNLLVHGLVPNAPFFVGPTRSVLPLDSEHRAAGCRASGLYD